MAARDQRLRLEALGEVVTSWEEAHGRLTETEVAEAERTLERAAAARGGAAA